MRPLSTEITTPRAASRGSPRSVLLEDKTPAETATIRAEHGAIREKLATLGVALDIHLVNEDMVKSFVDALRAHAAREESAPYRWAERDLPEQPRRSLFSLLRQAAQTLKNRQSRLTKELISTARSAGAIFRRASHARPSFETWTVEENAKRGSLCRQHARADACRVCVLERQKLVRAEGGGGSARGLCGRL